jgi:hypothetical protein
MATATVRIDPEGIYDGDSLYAELGVSAQALSRSRRDGSLKFARKGSRILYLGRWVLNWIAADAEGSAAEVATSV